MNTGEFAKKLKEQRLLKGESPNDLGDILGVGVKQINRYENGELPPPHESLEVLCKHYNFDFISLLYDFKGFNSERKILLVGEGNAGKSTTIDHFVERLLQEKDTVAIKIEEKARLAEAYASEMKQHYEDAKIEKAKMLDIINGTLKEISGNLKEAAINLAHNKDQLALLKDQTYIVSDQLEQQNEALGLNESPPVAPFVKKGNASSDVQSEGVKKGKRH